MQLNVFISSRLKELEEERAAVEEAVSELWNNENSPFTIWGWESAKEIPTGRHPDKVQFEGVRDSDIYVLILGSEYGDFEYGESPTHKEYDIACLELEEDCILIYVKGVGRREEKLENWIKELKNKHTTKSFKNSDQLKDLVKTRLRDLWNKGRWKVNIPTIQSTLRKGETFEGNFFKKEPEWIDFEKGFVVERKEVDEIIKTLEKGNIQLVLGEPASGKSVILKNIGFELANENKDVYIVELKKHSKDEVKCYFEDILEMKDEKAVFIVDDAHILSAECERLVREFKNRELKAKLIIGSRETREIRGERPKEVSEFAYLSKTDIHSEDVTEEMIKTFLKGIHHFSDERIKTVSKNLEEYKKDLWHLSWALKAYNPEKDSVEEEEIYEKIKDSIRNISAGKDKTRINAEDIFFPLSVFYRFEIPIEERFLEEYMGIKENIINELIDHSEIIETEEIGKRRTLSLNHSSIAELYFETYQNYPDLGENVKEIFQENDSYIDYPLFYQYMSSTPMNSLDVLIHLGIDWRDEKGGQTLLKKLFEDELIKNSIKEGIEKEGDILTIGLCVMFITEASKEVGLKLANRIDIDILASKIEREGDIEKIRWCMRNIAHASKDAGLELANRVNIEVLASKIEKEEDIEKIGWCVSDIAVTSEELALKLIEVVSSKIEEEEDIEKIGLCIWNIARACGEVALKLANRSVEVISSKIEKEEDTEKIGSCVNDIAEVSKEVGWELANRIDIKNLLSKIEKEGDTEKIRWCVKAIAKASGKAALKLVEVVSSKIEKEEDIVKIGSCVRNIAGASKKMELKLANHIDIKNLLSKIEKEEDIGEVGSSVMNIARASKEIGLKLGNRVNTEVLLLKIEKEEDIETIGLCVMHIAEASKEAGLKLSNCINIEVLSSKIEKEGNIRKIGWYMNDIAKVSKEIAREIVNRLNPKLQEKFLGKEWLK